jgi:HD-GYP domain-containing protein (c-di-GMP phosphodiesterase class II)
VDAFFRNPARLCADIDMACWETVLELDPERGRVLDEDQVDLACLAIADFADLKSPFFAGHSRAVAALAAGAASHAGLPAADRTDLARAGLVHDLGQVAVPARAFTGSSQGDAELEQLRLHPHYGERILSRAPALSRLAAIVGQHHERCDGSGYHRGTNMTGLSVAGRILAAAEAYQDMIEARAGRPAMSGEGAAAALRRQARAGALDGEAVAAVLAAAGHRVPVRRDLVAGLTQREIDVLRLIARGQSMKEIARTLGISPKTADNHTQNVYAKIGVKTRGGAVLFAIEHGLTSPDS